MIIYDIMRFVRKDTRHIFIDLWNEQYQSNIEMTLSFDKAKKATDFYNYYKLKLDQDPHFKIYLLDLITRHEHITKSDK